MTPSPATAQGQEGDIGLQTLQVKDTRQGMENFWVEDTREGTETSACKLYRLRTLGKEWRTLSYL